MGTVEKEHDVIKIFLVDGTCKGFLVTSTMTVNALKYLVAQKTNVDKNDWNNFGVFMASREKIVGPLVDRPYDVHKKWGRHSGFDLRFVFKRIDEPYPAEPEPEVDESAANPAAGIPAAGRQTPSAAGDSITGTYDTPPQTMKTTFGSPAGGSPNVFHRKITSTPSMPKAIDPTVSYNTAQMASQVQCDPEQHDLGYDYNLEMNTPVLDMTYMKGTGPGEDVYGDMGQADVPLTDSSDAIYSGFDDQSGMLPTEPVEAYMQHDQSDQPDKQQVIHAGISRTTSTQAPMRVPNTTAPKPPQRAQSTQVVVSPGTVPRVGGTVPKRPPPPSALRKSGKAGVKMITTNSAAATNGTASISTTPTTPPTTTTIITGAGAPKTAPKVNPRVGSPKTGLFKMPPSAGRPGSMQITAPPKAIPKNVAGAANSPTGSPPTQRRFLYKTEDATKSRHEQHKQIVVSWINSQLACRGISIRNLTGDIQDGVALIKLLEVLSEKKLEKYYGIPKMMMQKLDNLGHFLSFLRVLGIRIDGVSAEDLYVGNENLTLAILLVVLRKYGAAVPKPARRSSSARQPSSPSTGPQRKPSNGTTTEPVRKTSRDASTSSNSGTLTGVSPKRKPSNSNTTPTASPLRKNSKPSGSTSSPSFTMPPPARTKSGFPKVAPKRPGTPQLPRKTSDKVMPSKPAPAPPNRADPDTHVVHQITPPLVPSRNIVDQPPGLEAIPAAKTGGAELTQSDYALVKNLNSAVSDVDKILEELDLGGSQSGHVYDTPTMPDESPAIDYNNDDYAQYMDSFSAKMDDETMGPQSNGYDLATHCGWDSSEPEVINEPSKSPSATPELKFGSGSFVRSSPQSFSGTGSGTDSPITSPRTSSPRTALIGQRGSLSLAATPTEPTAAIAIPTKNTKLIAEASPASSPRFRNSPKPGNTKLPPHKMLMMHSQTSKYMSHNRGSSNYDSLKAASSPSLGNGFISPSNSSSPVTSPISPRKSSITDESGNVYTEVIKLDDLSAAPKGDVDPRYELDLTVNAGSKQKNSAFRDPENKNVLDLHAEMGDIDSLMENIMMTIGPSGNSNNTNNNNADISWD